MVANVIHSDVWDDIIYNLKFNLTIININIVIDYKIHILLTNTGILGEDKERSMTVDNVCLFFFFFFWGNNIDDFNSLSQFCSPTRMYGTTLNIALYINISLYV